MKLQEETRRRTAVSLCVGGWCLAFGVTVARYQIVGTQPFSKGWGPLGNPVYRSSHRGKHLFGAYAPFTGHRESL